MSVPSEKERRADMYHYLGIVTEEDLEDGYIVPSYILCQAHGESTARSGWRVIKQTENNSLKNMNKVLVKTIIGHEDMIEFLCSYRTRDHPHGNRHYTYEETKKYYPKGALFWFECNKYGEPGEYAIFITRVPRNIKGKTDAGFQMLKERMKITKPLKEILSQEPAYEANPFSQVKPKLVQRR